MPCFQRRTITQDLNVANREVLLEALARLGIRTRTIGAQELELRLTNGNLASIYAGKILVQDDDIGVINQIKVAYSRQIVANLTKKFGWVENEAKANEFVIQKRGF